VRRQGEPSGRPRFKRGSFWLVALTLGLGALIGLSATVIGIRHNRDSAAPSSTTSASPSAVDVGFAQAMAIHHGQAVLMADEAVLQATSPAVRLLAREILVEQSQEIGMMRTWLSDWNKPQLPTGSLMGWMQHSASTGKTASASMAGMPTSSGMPGMATNQQLAQLAAAKGTAFDRLFLTLMLRHHEGGIEMANYAAQHASLSQVRAAAGGMVIDQTNESTLIEELLKQ
jgi:uncharacterized protein (DUF305 family)